MTAPSLGNTSDVAALGAMLHAHVCRFLLVWVGASVLSKLVMSGVVWCAVWICRGTTLGFLVET